MPTSPAADPNTTDRNGGTFTTAMFMSGRLPSASGIRTTPNPWEWSCGFYPRSEPGEQQSDTAATFDGARADFERAWQVFLSNRTEADFQAWRDEKDWTARKYALWDAGKRLEPPNHGPGKRCSRFMKCPCGEVFDMHGPEAVLVHVPHIT
jgi:hypothetical protein